MDNLTHSLFAATLARTPLDRAGRGTTAALLIASNAPDIDIVAAAGGGGLGYLHWHRGPTHGPLGIVGLGLATAALVWGGRGLVDRRAAEPPRGNATFGRLALVSMLGVLLHILMDFPTSYGTRLLSPFDWHWFTTDLMPILDIYLILALAAALLLGGRSPARRRRAAALALAFMAVNYGARALLHQRAIDAAPRVLDALAPACGPRAGAGGAIAWWPRDGRATRPAGAEGPCLIEIAAMPDFLSPFRWRLIARESGDYLVRDVDLLDLPGERRDPGARAFRRIPDHWPDAALRAAGAPVAHTFLGFARFPAPRVATEPDGTTVVRWIDLRFGVPQRNVDPRASALFSAVVHLGPDGAVLAQGLGQ